MGGPSSPGTDWNVTILNLTLCMVFLSSTRDLPQEIFEKGSMNILAFKHYPKRLQLDLADQSANVIGDISVMHAHSRNHKNKNPNTAASICQPPFRVPGHDETACLASGRPRLSSAFTEICTSIIAWPTSRFNFSFFKPEFCSQFHYTLSVFSLPSLQ